MWADSAVESMRKQMELFERAAAFRASPRERIVALGEADEVYYHLHPHHYRTWQVVRIASQKGQNIGGREEAIDVCENRLVALLVQIILDGLEGGDLSLGGHTSAGELALTIWVLAFGTRAMMEARSVIRRPGDNGIEAARQVTDMLLDTIGWRPLSTEWDYAATRERIRRELFAAELSQIQMDAGSPRS